MLLDGVRDGEAGDLERRARVQVVNEYANDGRVDDGLAEEVLRRSAAAFLSDMCLYSLIRASSLGRLASASSCRSQRAHQRGVRRGGASRGCTWWSGHLTWRGLRSTSEGSRSRGRRPAARWSGSGTTACRESGMTSPHVDHGRAEGHHEDLLVDAVLAPPAVGVQGDWRQHHRQLPPVRPHLGSRGALSAAVAPTEVQFDCARVSRQPGVRACARLVSGGIVRLLHRLHGREIIGISDRAELRSAPSISTVQFNARLRDWPSRSQPSSS